MNVSEVDPPAEPVAPPWWRAYVVGRNPWVTAVRLAFLVALTFLAFRHVFVPVQVTGISMTPTYRDGERRWISPLKSRFQGLQRGDVVAIQMTGRHVMYLKRIVGLPGERILIVRGRVFIDDEELEEPYVSPRRLPWNWPASGAERLLGPDEYFVVGDNRSMAMDAHFFGIAERRRILGEVLR